MNRLKIHQCVIVVFILSVTAFTLFNVYRISALFGLDEFYGKEVKINISEVVLKNAKGDEVTFSKVKKPYYLFFGFTKCKEVCPRALGSLRSIRDRLNGNVDIVFISIDPQRDNSSVLLEFETSHDRFFSALSSSKTFDTRDLSSRLNAYVERRHIESPDDQIGHAGFIFLADLDSEVRLLYPYRNLDVDRVLDDYYKIFGSIQ